MTPILILLIFSFVVSLQSKVNIALIDKSGDAFGTYIESTLEDTELIKVLDIKEADIEASIQGEKIEFAVVIGNVEDDTPITVIKSKNSSVATYMESILNGAVAGYGKEKEKSIARNGGSLSDTARPIGAKLWAVGKSY